MKFNVTFVLFNIIFAAACKTKASLTKQKFKSINIENKLGKYLYTKKIVGEIQINTLLPLRCLHSHSQIISSDS